MVSISLKCRAMEKLLFTNRQISIDRERRSSCGRTQQRKISLGLINYFFKKIRICAFITVKELYCGKTVVKLLIP